MRRRERLLGSETFPETKIDKNSVCTFHSNVKGTMELCSTAAAAAILQSSNTKINTWFPIIFGRFALWLQDKSNGGLKKCGNAESN